MNSKASKRAKRLAGMFGQVDPAALEEQAAAERSQDKSMTTAPTKALQASFSSIERDNIKLREELEKSKPQELDPDLVFPSLIQDRMEWTEEDPAFQSLLESIREQGQKLPVLVRPHPDIKGSYQLAYGSRRNRACKVLGLKVKAYVEELTDEQLVIAQGLENNERQNLSFIEQALYAQALSEAGYARKVIAGSIGVGNETVVSKMTAIAAQIPREICELIGPAPKVGRPRWEAFSVLMEVGRKKPSVVEAVNEMQKSEVWKKADSNRRFDLAFRAAEKADKNRTTKPKASKSSLTSGNRIYGTLEQSSSSLKITINAKTESGFAKFISEQMSALISEYEKKEKN